MGKKQISLFILTSLIMLVVGLVAGQFVKIPTFKAADDQGLSVPMLVAATNRDPETDSVTVVGVDLVYTNSSPFTCPTGYVPSSDETFPYYLTRKITGLKPGQHMFYTTWVSDDDLTDWRRKVGYNLYYQTVTSTDKRTISARLIRHESVDATRNPMRWYNLESSQLRSTPLLQDVLLSELIASPQPLPKKNPQTILCALPGSGGGGS